MELISQYNVSMPCFALARLFNDDYTGDLSPNDIKAIDAFKEDLPKHHSLCVDSFDTFFDKYHDLEGYGVLATTCQWVKVSEYKPY